MRASRDDEVYFYHAGEPVSGRVVCAGKTGCTVESKGKQHKLKWDKIVGFKKRAEQRYRILEEGEDGCIVENQHGKRKFLRIPAESRDDQLQLTKKEVHGVHNPDSNPDDTPDSRQGLAGVNAGTHRLSRS